MSDADVFLRALWTEKPDKTAIQLWRKSDHKTFSFAAIEPAVDWVDGNGSCDIYMAAGLAAKAGRPSKTRANADAVVGIAGVWADIDINGGPENKTGAAPDLDAAHELADALLRPTLVVNSGYGLQAWWLFDEAVWPFYTVEDRDYAKKIVTGFQGALKAQAKRLGFTIDSTFDLARLMRVPGGFNHKGAGVAPVELLDDGGPRHGREAIEEAGKEYQNTRSLLGLVTGEGVNITVNPKAQPDMMQLEELFEIDDTFKLTWSHKPQVKSKNWSTSEYEFSITNTLVAAGWTDQEICDALVYHRNKYDGGDQKGKNRADRIAQTIGKVRATSEYEIQKVKREEEREEATNQLVAIGEDAGIEPEIALGLFNKILGGPEIKELIQTGRDPDTCRFVLSLANGDEVDLKDITGLLDQSKFRARFAAVTGYLVKRTKKWDEIAQALLNTRHLREEVEDTRAYRAWEMVNEYAERRVSTDRDMACQTYDPFVSSGTLYIPLGPFHQYLRRVRGERMADVDLRGLIEAAGFERKTVNYMRDDDTRSTRSYFAAPWQAPST